MAEQPDDSEKTEEPSQKKLDDARQKGDVPKSTEIAHLVTLAAGIVIIMALGGQMARHTAGSLTGFLSNAAQVPMDAGGVMDLARAMVWLFILITAVPFVVLVIAAILGHVGQTGFVISTEKLQPKLDKLSPIKGLGRMLGKPALANFAKGIGKLVFVAVAGCLAVWPMADQLGALVWVDVGQLLGKARDGVVVFTLAALAVYAVIAGIDLVMTRQSWMQKQRMTRKEVKDEYKNQEGDPHIKNKLRAIRQQKSRERMMAAVPDATVVVANPTHYAVALKYEDGSQKPPICVAKGVDYLALRIRRVAEDHEVPVVENPPLARALYAALELEQPVPVEHFAAVAKVIGTVLKIARNRSKTQSNR